MTTASDVYQLGLLLHNLDRVVEAFPNDERSQDRMSLDCLAPRLTQRVGIERSLQCTTRLLTIDLGLRGRDPMEEYPRLH